MNVLFINLEVTNEYSTKLSQRGPKSSLEGLRKKKHRKYKFYSETQIQTQISW